jgi:hypothetical protein
MPPTAFEPTNPARKRPQNYALDRETIGIGHYDRYFGLTKQDDEDKW